MTKLIIPAAIAGIVIIIVIIGFTSMSTSVVHPKTFFNSESTMSTIKEPSSNTIQTISTGWWAGECKGYCRASMTLTADTIDFNDIPLLSTCPQIVEELQYSKKKWDHLMKLVDLEKFHALPDAIGQPGATDAAIWHIEISEGRNSKRISFEAFDELTGIEEFRSVLTGMFYDVESKYSDIC